MELDGDQVQERIHSWRLWNGVIQEAAKFEVEIYECKGIHGKVIQVGHLIKKAWDW